VSHSQPIMRLLKFIVFYLITFIVCIITVHISYASGETYEAIVPVRNYSFTNVSGQFDNIQMTGDRFCDGGGGSRVSKFIGIKNGVFDVGIKTVLVADACVAFTVIASKGKDVGIMICL